MILRSAILTVICAALCGVLVASAGTYDLVIYGSSSAALSAAVQAKRMGVRAVVVSPETRIGGLTTGGLGQTDIGNKSAFGGLALRFYRDVAAYYREEKNWKWQSRGDYLPDGQCAGSKGEDSMWTFEPSAALAILEGWERQEGLEIHRGRRLDRSAGKVKVRGEGEQRRIVSFVTEDGTEYRGKMFIDATYEGDLLAAAGVSYTVGREANDVYGETLNGVQTAQAKFHQLMEGVSPYVKPDDPKSGLLPNVEPYDPNLKDGQGDRRMQAYCFRMCLTDVPENRIPFAKPEGYDERDYELLFRHMEAKPADAFKGDLKWKLPWINSRMPNRKTDTNNRDGFSTDFIGRNWSWPEASYAEREAILAAHLKYQRGLMWTLANHPRVPQVVRDVVSQWGTCRDEFRDGLGDGWQSQLYVREGRRLVGDYVMTEANCVKRRVSPRPVAMAAYTMDSHHVRRHVGADGFVHNEGDVEVGCGRGPYGIDYGAIVPKRGECANLFVPVCLSASHIAFGSIRMEPVFFALGQAAATAAAQAIAADCAVQDLPYGPLAARLLADGQVIRSAQFEPIVPGAEPLVVRTDFDVSPTWERKKIGGHDFLPMFRQVYWTGWLRKEAPLAMYHACVDQVDGWNKLKRNDITDGGKPSAGEYARWVKDEEKFAKPYTFEEAYGEKLKAQDEPGREAYPFFLSMSGDRPSFFLKRDYPLADRASYAKWRTAHPNCLGAFTLGEYDQQAMWYRSYVRGNKDKSVAEALLAAFPMPPKDTLESVLQRDWFPKWVRECFAREQAYYFGETNLWTMCSGCPSLQHIMGEVGACGFSYEATTQGAGSWTVPGAFTRGAARQFGVPFGWYGANFVSGYTRDGKFCAGENSLFLDPARHYKHLGRDRGASRSIIRRQLTYGWLIGAALIDPENWYVYHMEEVKGKGEGEAGRFVPSVFAKDMQELCDRAKTMERGISYTPLAVLVPLWERHSRSGYDRHNCDPWSLTAVSLTLEPPNQEQNDKDLYDLARRKGDESCFFNSPFGGIYDIVAPDATRNRANIRKTLGAYKAAIVAGDFRKAELLPHLFEDYAAAGGTLFVSGDKIAKGVVDSAAAGVAFGKKTVPSGKKMATVHSSTSTSNFDSSTPLSSPYDIMLPEGTPTAKPLYVDELGNVLVWTKDHGKGRIVTVACDRMLPREYAKCPPDHVPYKARLLAAARTGFRFDLIHTLLTRIQSETMPVSVDGDIMWGVNKVKVRGEGEGWMVWLFNNKGVTKFVGEPEKLDASKTATVTVRCGDKSKTVTVGPGAIEYVTFEK